MTNGSSRNQELIVETSLQTFFFVELTQVNQERSRPLPRERGHYSSIVLDQYGDSGKYFETVECKGRDTILGLKLLETCYMPKSSHVMVLKDSRDTALFLCDFFSASLNGRIVETSYYQQVGSSAYSKLNHLVPDVYETPSFYKQLSRSFSGVTMLMNIVAEKMTKPDQFEGMLLYIGDRNIKAS